MELGMSHGKFTGKCHNCGKHGHKAAECWSGSKYTMLQPIAYALPIDNTKAKQVANTESEGQFFMSM